MAGRSTRTTGELLGGLDRSLTSPLQRLFRRRSTRDAVLGAATLTVLALVCIPVRDSVGAANIGVAMAIVVGVVGFRAGLRPGIVTAIYAAALFALVHSAPHGFPRIEDEQDAVTALLLVAMGVLSGLVHQRSTELEDQTRQADYAFGRVHRVGEVAATANSLEAVMDAVASEVASELRLVECRWEPDAPVGEMTQLRHNGLIDGLAHDASPDEVAAALAGGVALAVGSAGRLVLVGGGSRPVSSAELRVAVVLADYGAAVGAGRE